jgi:hypothetical protein
MDMSRPPPIIRRPRAVSLRRGTATVADQPALPSLGEAVDPVSEEDMPLLDAELVAMNTPPRVVTRGVRLPDMPRSRGRPRRFNILEMEVGDSFYENIPKTKTKRKKKEGAPAPKNPTSPALLVYKNIRAAIRHQIKDLPGVKRKFTIRRDGDRWWCMRIM